MGMGIMKIHKNGENNLRRQEYSIELISCEYISNAYRVSCVESRVFVRWWTPWKRPKIDVSSLNVS